MAELGRKHIHVVCAVIERDGLALAAQRNAIMSLPFKWEFPGGKIKAGENSIECLRREILEELGVAITVIRPLSPTTHEYQEITVTLYPFVCAITEGKVQLHEHAAMIWLPPVELSSLDWAAADLPVLAAYLRQLET